MGGDGERAESAEGDSRLKSSVGCLMIGNHCQFGDNRPMPTKNVNLSEKQAKFIRHRVEGGGYRNASEVVRAGLRLLEQREQEDKLKLRALRRLTKKAFGEIDRGKFDLVEPNALDAFLDKLDKRGRASQS